MKPNTRASIPIELPPVLTRNMADMAYCLHTLLDLVDRYGYPVTSFGRIFCSETLTLR
ncbi:hypothetical protein [Nitrosovibrio sp. Nv4]|uniref:hypothetical protein n=1 Tax=Nitrosovibrio sp. Nv4 TaxID=1945880 RepID=UPI0013583FC8|nr:hypothetical protein [Nitrosovibrio sp. Nv4]